jgi:steroid delta-isomerase-like uncharacterized protein
LVVRNTPNPLLNRSKRRHPHFARSRISSGGEDPRRHSIDPMFLPLGRAPSLSLEANKELMTRFFAETSAGNPDAMVEMIADDFVVHTPIPNIAPGKAGFRAFMDVFFGAFPEQTTVVQDVLAEGGKVAVRHTHNVVHGGVFVGMPPTGKKASVEGIEIFRIENGKIAEMWHQDDLLSLLIQLGAVPPPGQRDA